MPPKHGKKSPAIQNPENSESSEFVDAPSSIQFQPTTRSTRANPRIEQNDLDEENVLIVANSLNDLPTRRPTSRSVSPVASGSSSKSASNKKNQRNKQSSKEDFQAPVGVPIANRKSSTTILGTPRNQKTINDYTSSGGSHLSRKQSYEDSSLQMQLVNRQTIEVKKLIDNNNVDLEEKIAKMINKGETSMLNRLEEFLVARDNALERSLTQQILDGDRKLTNQMNDRLRENEINIERKIDISITDCQSNLKLDLARSINDSMARFTSRLDNLEDSTYICFYKWP